MVDVSMRVIADHVRTIAFSIADNQLPSNAKAGYVIRRILRRAVRYAYTFLGQKQAFMYRLIDTLIESMGEAYPELPANRELIPEGYQGRRRRLPPHSRKRYPPTRRSCQGRQG